MSFITYAQNFEDVMLWRALKYVGVGFYIDVGAWSPNIDSVTRAFYEAGWHGVNVEPNPEFYEQLERDRPRDINLRVAVGDHEGSVTINFVSNPGLSTANDAFAEQHAKDGWAVRREEVRLTTLAAIWGKHITPGQEVHFLKIDVEGLEEAVVRGNDWGKNRPWVLLIEATLPMSQVESFDGWEPVLLANRYAFAYADGLNRYYVADEHADLMAAFKYPPNVFDDFLLATQLEARLWADEAHASAERAHAFAAQADIRAEQAALSQRLLKSELNLANENIWRLESRKAALESELYHVYLSRSWRITAPLRWFAHQTSRLRQEGLKHRLNALIHKLLRKARHFLLKHPGLQHFLKLTGLHALLRYAFVKINGLISNHQPLKNHCSETISLRSRKIYSQLKAAITRQNKADQ